MTDLNKLAADIAEGRGLHTEIEGIIANIQDVPYLAIQTAALRAFNGKYDRALNNAEQLLQPEGGEDEAAKRRDIIALLAQANNYVLDPRWARLSLRSLEYELHAISPQALDEYYCRGGRPGEREEEPWRWGTYNPATGMCTYRYNRERAVDYATFYASGTNSLIFERIPDADCANYASQTLHYGGLPMEGRGGQAGDEDPDDSSHWMCNKVLICSGWGSWTVTGLLINYLTKPLEEGGVGARAVWTTFDSSLPLRRQIADFRNAGGG